MDLLRYQLHIFDLDDTLIVTRPTYWGAQEDALKDIFSNLNPGELAEKATHLAWMTKQFSSSYPELYGAAFFKDLGHKGREAEHLLERFLDLYHHYYWQNIQSMPGVIEWLTCLQKEGRQIALVSNGTRETQYKKLKATGLFEYFQEQQILVSGEYPADYKKPSPKLLEICLEQANLLPSQCLFYGNLHTDVLAANMAGMDSLYIGEAYQARYPLEQPTYHIANFKEFSC